MAQPILPGLRTNHQVGLINAVGQWERRQVAEMANLSDGLDFGNIIARSDTIDSIPDIWARPLLFDMALYDTSHPLHDRILGEWRGLLTMMAFREVYELSQLTVFPVELPSRNTLDVDMQDIHPFAIALAKLMPDSDRLATDTDWNNLYVILFGDRPLGMTSPTTLVCTAADYSDSNTEFRDNILRNIITWFDGNLLKNPIPFLNDIQKDLLGNWLENLRQKLQNHGSLHPEKSNNLFKCIKEFQRDLKFTPQQIGLKSSFLLETGIYRHLNECIKPAPPDPDASHVKLQILSEDTELPKLLIVDGIIASQWQLNQNRITILGGISLANLPSDLNQLGSDRTSLLNLNLPQNTEWRLPQDFFTNTLFIIPQATAFPGVAKIEGCDRLDFIPILPIKSELLQYIPAKQLLQRLSIESSGRNGTITIRLRLPLQGIDGNGKDFEIRKDYYRTNIGGKLANVIEIPHTPIITIWPKFQCEQWKAYYTFYSSRGKQNTFYAQPFLPRNSSAKSNRIRGTETEISATITLTNQFPEALTCSGNITNDSNPKGTLVEGLILLDLDPIKKIAIDPGKTWKIGVDFGTTSTHICRISNETESSPESLNFDSHLFSITHLTNGENINIYDDFLPSYRQPTPFLSFLQIFIESERLGQFQTLSQLDLPILDSHIRFLYADSSLGEEADGMRFNLKWSKDMADRKAAELFLKQLCLQSTAEAVANGVGKIAWFYSYPSAFDESTADEFADIWTTRIGKFLATQVNGVSFYIDRNRSRKIESVAAAKFFADRYQEFGASAVCIDIGGGTSDISIWQGYHLKWQTSIQLAGRHIFLDILYENPSFLSRVFQVPIGPLETARKEGKKAQFYAQADFLINQFGNRWLENLSLVSGTPGVKNFISLLAFGFAGLYHYSGLLLNSLHRQEIFAEIIPDIYIGGNGARLLNWLDLGKYRYSSRVNNLFKDIILQASGFNTYTSDFSVNISTMPKAEVAYGLVTDLHNLTIDMGEIDKNVVIAGENFGQNGHLQPWYYKIDAASLHSGLDSPIELEQLQLFIERFNQCTEKYSGLGILPVEIGGDVYTNLLNNLRGYFNACKTKSREDMEVEPIFIYTIRKLLQILARRWSFDSQV